LVNDFEVRKFRPILRKKIDCLSGEVTSICSKDYSRALANVSKWIKENARHTYFFQDLSDNDEVLSGWLEKEKTGETLELSPGIDYEIAGNKINFINSKIDPEGG
jgi:hypothetical protein